MKTTHTTVLIVGAGPTGLMAACQLARYGVNFRIIEKNSSTTPLSKALVLHARSLEVYDQMSIADEAIEQGWKAVAANLVVKGRKVQRVPLGDIGSELSPFPFMLMLEQSKNEELLYKELKKFDKDVEWEVELIDYQQDDDIATAKVRQKTGEEEIITADWVIAADGGKSVIRHTLGLKFEGDTYENIFYVVDTQLQWDLGYNELFVNLVDASFCGFFPMGEGRFRLVGILPKEFENEDDIKFETIKNVIKKEQQIDLEFGEVNWFSIYRVHHRHIESFRKGRTFFAGDSAHVHSPAGGQGMNTGLQDAYNLCWKLALHLQGKAKIAILDSYNEERLPNAIELVKTTDRAFSNIIAKGKLINFFKLNILPYIAGTVMGWESVRKMVFKRLSQIGIHYRESAISHNGVSLSKAMPHAGDRLPYVMVYDEEKHGQISIYDWLRTTRFVALICLHNEDAIGETAANAVIETLESNYEGLFDCHIIRNITENMVAFAQLHLHTSMLMLVRPDGYIGYIAKVDDLTGMTKYLNTFLCASPSYPPSV